MVHALKTSADKLVGSSNDLAVSLCLLLLVLSFSSSAQILNVEKSRFRSDTARWVGVADLLMNIRQQETATFSSRLRINFAWITQRDYFIAIGDYNRARAEGVDVVQDGYLHLRVGLFRKRFLSPEVFYQIQQNEIRGMQRRNLIGGGIVMRLVRSESVLFSVGISSMYEAENWNFEEDIARTRLWKNSDYLSLHWTINEVLDLNTIVYYQAGYDRFFQPRVSGETNLNIRISNRFRFTSSFVGFYDRRPPVDVLKWTYTFKNGIGFAF